MVNQLPQGWKEVPFNSIFDVCNSGKEKIKQSEYLPETEGLLPVVDQGQNLVSGYSDQFQKVVLAKDNPLIVFGDHTRCVKYIDFDFVVGADGTQLIRTKANTSVKLGYYQLMSANIPNNGYSRHFKYVKEQTYKLIADKDEQNYIVKTLDAVAEMIKLRKETIQLTKDLIPAIFQEMFGDPNIEDVNYVPFNQFFVVVNNEKKEIKSEDYRTKADGLLPVVDQGKKEIVAYTEQLDKKISAHDNPIILFGDHTREVKFIDFDFVVGADGTQLMRTVEGVEPLFAFWQLKMKHIESKGYSRHFKYVKAMKFLIADNTKQKEFAKKVEQINQNLEVQQKDLDRLQELFDQLLQKAFTGELTRGDAYGKH